MSTLHRMVEEYEAEQERKGSEENSIANKVMLTQDILEIVFKHLDFFRLKLCRTVCKIWNEEICRGLRNRSVSYVQTDEDYSTFRTVVISRRGHQELPELIQSLSVNIRSSFMLKQVPGGVPVFITKLEVSAEMDCHHSATTSQLHSLLERYRSTLTSLKVPFCSISGSPELRGRSEELEFPLLKEFHLTVLERNLAGDHQELPQMEKAVYVFPVNPRKVTRALAFFSKLTHSAPKLTQQEIVWYSGPVIETILPRQNLGKMTSVKIWTAGPLTPVCQALLQIRFEKLKSLSLHTRSREIVPLQRMVPTLLSAAETLETLSLDNQHEMFLQLPAVKTYEVRHFSPHSWGFINHFPNLTTVRIHRVHPALGTTFQTCPASLERVEIGFGQNLLQLKGSLWSLYHFFTPRVKAWELPFEYVEDFCDFIASEREGRGVQNLTIGFEPQHPPRSEHQQCRHGFDFYWPALGKGLEKTVNLLDLKELTLKNSESGFSLSTWNSLSPHIFRRLHTFTYFSNTGFAELPELASKLKLVRKVVLLGNRPVRFDTKTDQAFSALPNATVRYEGGQGAAERMYDLDGGF